MSKPFTGSRLANLRQKRTSQAQNIPAKQTNNSPLNLPDEQITSDYQPSMSFQANRTGTRFLKNKIEKTNNLNQDGDFGNGNSNNNYKFAAKQSENVPPQERQSLVQSTKEDVSSSGGLKLVLNDSPQFDKKKAESIKVQSTQAPQKRLLIQKKQSVQEPIKQQVRKPEQKKSISNIQQQVVSVKRQSVVQNNQAIKQEQIQESKDFGENENELIQCPQGCGRKFNRKALEKHAKACKLVFMSKRKEFNSQAKRFTSQQQANLVKQTKIQEKKAVGKGKTKDMGKTSDNWKAASQDFRSALKAVKKDDTNKDGQEQSQLKTIVCQFCEKPFAEMLLANHQQNCLKKKQKQLKQKKKTQKKK